MVAKIDVPKELTNTFERLMEKIPVESREDIDLQQAVLLFLKMDGETLASHYIHTMNMEFNTNFEIMKRRLHDEDIKEDTEDNEDDLEEDEEEDDDDELELSEDHIPEPDIPCDDFDTPDDLL